MTIGERYTKRCLQATCPLSQAPSSVTPWTLRHVACTVLENNPCIVFIARQQHTNADARYWYRNSVRLSVCHVPTLYRNGLTYRHTFFRHVAPSLHHSSFPSSKHVCEIPTGLPPRGALQNTWGYMNFAIFYQYLAMETIEDTAIAWNDNRKSYALYWTVTFPMTLSDPWRSFRWPTYCC